MRRCIRGIGSGRLDDDLMNSAMTSEHMNILILGCGVVGTLVGNRLTAEGHAVVGIRRRPDFDATPAPLFPIQAGNIADPATLVGLPLPDAVLLAANPGVRRGRDNGLAQAANLVAGHFPQARFVYTGSTSVYGDAGGATIQEDGPLGTDGESLALLAIEAAVLAHPRALILRATALVGPSRQQSRIKAREALDRGAPISVRGDPARPFSWLHEADLADLCCCGLLGLLGYGVLNAATPDDDLTVQEYYRRQAGVPGAVVEGDGSPAPRRRIGQAALLRRLPSTWRWRSLAGD